MTKKEERCYVLGSEWLYYKLYMGSTISEQFLISQIKPIGDYLIENGLIDKWFFINFNDPNRHIRIRLHLTNPTEHLKAVIMFFHKAIKPYLDSKLIKDVNIGTYKRELERYGFDTINDFETLFFYNSKLIVDIIEHIEEDQNKRWLYALKAIDVFLNDWELNLAEKSKFLNFLDSSYSQEMGSTTSTHKHLSKKFRNHRKKVESTLKENTDVVLEELLQKHSIKTKKVIDSIYNKIEYDKDIAFSYLDSYVHMHCNRLFTSRQRINEWVLYWYLSKHYKSELARNK